LPEVAGEAALLVNPYNAHEIAIAIVKVLMDPILAANLGEMGLRQAQGFSWEKTAHKTAAVYHKMLEG
jgi:glycosyltransferase involved in cell wall biosynthesis